MDLRTHARVISRFRVVAVCGLALAFALALLSVVRVSTHGLAYRQAETWQSTEMLSVTPHGCGIFCQSQDLPPTSYLAQIANSALIRNQVLPNGRATLAGGDYLVSAVTDQSQQNATLPLLEVDGTATSASRAARVASRASSTFISFVQHTRAPSAQRIDVQVVTPAQAADAKVVHGRKLTTPIFIFLAVFVAVLGLIYLLENLNPRAGGVEDEHDSKHEARLEAVEPVGAPERPRRRSLPTAPTTSDSPAPAAAETTRSHT